MREHDDGRLPERQPGYGDWVELEIPGKRNGWYTTLPPPLRGIVGVSIIAALGFIGIAAFGDAWYVSLLWSVTVLALATLALLAGRQDATTGKPKREGPDDP